MNQEHTAKEQNETCDEEWPGAVLVGTGCARRRVVADSSGPLPVQPCQQQRGGGKAGDGREGGTIAQRRPPCHCQGHEPGHQHNELPDCRQADHTDAE